MIALSLWAASLDLQSTPVRLPAKWTAYLEQRFFEDEESAPCESLAFRIVGEYLAGAPGQTPAVRFQRLLERHILDGLALPPSTRPLEYSLPLHRTGVPAWVALCLPDPYEFRLERLRAFVPPERDSDRTGKWTFGWPAIPDHEIPKLRIEYRASGAAQADGSRWYAISAEETDGHGLLTAAGKARVRWEPFEVLEGEWSSPRVRMPGGEQTEYRLVQTLAPRLKPNP